MGLELQKLIRTNRTGLCGAPRETEKGAAEVQVGSQDASQEEIGAWPMLKFLIGSHSYMTKIFETSKLMDT